MLKHELNETQVYLWSEVVSFCKVFYLPPEKQTAGDHAKMEKFVQPAVDRFYDLDEETRETFHSKLTAYVSLYAFMIQIMPYPDEELELLYGYGRFLLPHIPTNRDTPPVHPEDDVELKYYRLTMTPHDMICLDDGETVPVKSPTETGTGKGADEKKPLSEIIKALNDRLGTEFTDEDRLFFEQIQEKAIADERVRQTAQANTLDKFEIGIRKIVETLMIQRMAENDAIVSRYMDDPDFQKVVFPILAKNIYRSITKPEPYPNAPFSSAIHE
jgi:type I restriction enzyme R subunit